MASRLESSRSNHVRSRRIVLELVTEALYVPGEPVSNDLHGRLGEIIPVVVTRRRIEVRQFGPDFEFRADTPEIRRHVFESANEVNVRLALFVHEPVHLRHEHLGNVVVARIPLSVGKPDPLVKRRRIPPESGLVRLNPVVIVRYDSVPGVADEGKSKCSKTLI